MILISEWLPNPLGSDSTGEWVELLSSGNASADLSGWRLQTKSGSKVMLGGRIGPGEYQVFYRSKTKLVLKNADEGLFLYDAGGKLVDQSIFLGTAPEGKSFSRSALRSFSEGGQGTGNFVWSDPTPGAQNKISLDTSVARNNYPLGAPLNHPLGTPEIMLLALGIGIAFAAVTIFIIKRNDDIS